MIEGVDPWTFEVLGVCCGRARLNYTIQYHPTPRSITVQCTPNPVVRGENVTCSASPSQPGAAMTVSEWRFESVEVTAPIIESSNSPTWAGQAAVGGLVKVTGVVDGAPAAGDTLLTVNGRPWSAASGDTVSFQITDISSQGLPEHPTQYGDLGNTANIAGAFIPPNGYVQVTGGPNNGVL